MAAEKAKYEAGKKHDAEIKVSMIEQRVNGKDKVLVDLEFANTTLNEKKTELADVTEKGKSAKAEMERCQEAWNGEQLRQQKENDARRAVDQVTAEINVINADVARYSEAVQNKAIYEKEIAEYESLQKTVEAENEKYRKHTEANMEKQQKYQKEKDVFDVSVKALESERNDLREQCFFIERLIENAKGNIKLYERDTAEINENCPACDQQLPTEKLSELKVRRERFLAKISNENEEIKKNNGKLEELNKKIKAVHDQIADHSLDEPTPVKLDSFNDTVLRNAADKMNRIDITQIRAMLDKVREAGVRIESLKSQLAEKNKLFEERSKAVLELTTGIEEGIGIRLRRELDSANLHYTELTEKYSEVKAQIARQESVIEAAKNTLAEIEMQEKELELLKKQILDSTCEAASWELISKAFGKDGIQALELDALAPGISDTANRILESAYGDRFKIAIETTRIGGAGKKTKQIEDFVIKVIDSEDGEAVNLEDKSGGEAVWIKRAIYDAFSVIRKRNTNFAFLSCFQDEADGALDSAAKTAYCRMLEAAHAESKLRHTFIITHSNEVKAMIDQKIDMEDL